MSAVVNAAGRAFFETLYGPRLPADHNGPSLADNARNTAELSLWRGKDKRSVHFHEFPPAMALSHISALDAACSGPYADFDYYGVGLRRADANLDQAHRGGAKDVGWLPGLWVDIDLEAPGAHKAKDPLPPDLATAIDLVGCLEHTPTIVVHSGYGLHLYYLFPSLEDIRDPARHALAARTLETLQLRVIGAGVAAGFHVDSTYDLARVLRIPGTANRKRHETACCYTAEHEVKDVFTGVVTVKPMLLTACVCPTVTVLDEGGERVSLEAWAAHLGCTVVAPTSGSGRHMPPPLPGGPPTPAGWPPAGPPVPLVQVRARLGALRRADTAQMAASLLAGVSIADSERDAAMQKLANAVAFVAPDNPIGTAHPDDLLPLWRGSLAHWAAEPTATLTLQDELDKAADKMRRGQQESRALHAAERAELAALSARFAARTPAPDPTPADANAAGSTGGVSCPSPDSATQSAPASVELAPPEEVGPYTPEEVEQIMDELGVDSIDALNRRWIVQRGATFYLLTHRGCPPGQVARYSQPFGRTFLLGTMRDYLSRAGLDWFTTGARGAPKLCDDEAMVARYGTQAEYAEAHLDLQVSRYDEEKNTFYEAVCPLRRLAPKFHADVDGWLRALGGTQADKLLDWVATATRLDMLTCALYLSGPPGTGKSLFAAGLARLWTTGGPTELARILENFNEDLARCPLIFADEGLPSKGGRRQTSVELRTLIGSKKRTLSRKYVSNSDLHGCPRLILAANNERLLAFNEDLEPDDIQAMAERFLHIDTSAAAGHLSALGGAAVVQGWVDQDIIAEHALWLRDNRQVQPGERFLVVGSRSKVHESIATRGSFQGLVTEWLVKQLVTPSKAITGQAIRIGGGAYLVNTNVVSMFWDQHIRSDKTPETARIGRVLKGLGVPGAPEQLRMKDKDGKMVRVHSVRPEALVAWGVENQLGEADTMWARINAPVEAEAPVEAPPTPTGQVFRLDEALKALKKDVGQS